MANKEGALRYSLLAIRYPPVVKPTGSPTVVM
jgi:hypothetical protein